MTMVAEVLSARCINCRITQPTGTQVPLSTLKAGVKAVLVGFDDSLDAPTTRRLMDLGFLPGRCVELVRKAPMRDPLMFRVCDYELVLRGAQAGKILVQTEA